MVTSMTPAPMTKDLAALAVLFTTSGTAHLVRPHVFESIIPAMLPRKRELVYLSGIAELACAAGLLHPRTRKAAGYASAALLLAVFPANVQMSADHTQRAVRGGGAAGASALALATLARLPLQWPMIRTALRAAGRL